MNVGITLVSCRDLPYTIFVHKNKQRSAEIWCKSKLGKRWEAIGYRDGIWTCFWAGREHPSHYAFHFKNEQDALVFSLSGIH